MEFASVLACAVSQKRLVGATRTLARTYLYHDDQPVDLIADVAVRFVIGGLTARGAGDR